MVGSRIRAWVEARARRVPAFLSEVDAACEHLAAPHVIGPDPVSAAEPVGRPRHLASLINVPELQTEDS